METLEALLLLSALLLSPAEAQQGRALTWTWGGGLGPGVGGGGEGSWEGLIHRLTISPIFVMRNRDF